jgi:hypothetical protein
MKKLFSSLLFLPIARTGPTNSVEIRSGKWPISLERNGASYSLIFRNQQEIQAEAYDTVEFLNKGQLVYLDSALMVLKKGHDGDQAEFTNYTVKRADKKYDGMWYMLQTKYATTNFRQHEADLISQAIRGF